MIGLSENMNIVELIIFVELTILVVLVFAFGIIKIYRNQYNKLMVRVLDSVKKDIDSYISENQQLVKSKRMTSMAVKNYLINLSKKISGNELVRLVELYNEIGFYKKDIRDLSRYSYKKKYRALYSISSLKQPIPRDLFGQLLKSKNKTISWIAMKTHILSSGYGAFFDLIAYIRTNENIHKGIVFYLLNLYFEKDPDSLPIILERSDIDGLTEAALYLTNLHNLPQNENLILKKVGLESDSELIILVLKSINIYSKNDHTYLSMILSEHDNYVVRAFSALLLTNSDFSNPKVSELAENYLRDSSYLVRDKISHVLIANSSAKDQLDKIYSDREHPGHQALYNKMARNNFYA